MFCFYRCGAHESQDAMIRSPGTALLQASHVVKTNHVVGLLKSRDKIESRDRSAARKHGNKQQGGPQTGILRPMFYHS